MQNRPIKNSKEGGFILVVDDEDNVLLDDVFELNAKGEVLIEIPLMPFDSTTVEITVEYHNTTEVQVVNRINSQKHHFVLLNVLTKMYVKI